MTSETPLPVTNEEKPAASLPSPDLGSVIENHPPPADDGAAPHAPLSPSKSSVPPEETRTPSTDDSLTPQQKVKLAKAEAKELRRQSKLLKDEAKAEKQALTTAERELSGIQKIHDVAVKNEAKANAKHNKVMREFQKFETTFLATRTKFEAAQARLHAEDENVEIVRNNAKESAAEFQKKMQEVDTLRAKYTSDEKERTVKLNELASKGANDGGCVIA